MRKRTTELSDQELWDQKAEDWHKQVGNEGDYSRTYRSDPILWEHLELESGFSVLDAGCGTGYLARKIAKKGGIVTGVDLSPEMIRVAKRESSKNNLSGTYHTDSCESLETLDEQSFERIVSNYVWMDLPDIQAAAKAHYRVLKPGGKAIIVVIHPCFPLDIASVSPEGTVSFSWKYPYFEHHALEGKPWGHFTSNFTFYHHSLEDYFQAFFQAGFQFQRFFEPTLVEDFPKERQTPISQGFPHSIVFVLSRPKT